MLKVGDEIPEFNLKTDEGIVFNSTKELKEQATVIYFYPKNFTPGCTKEACAFRDVHQEFLDAGARIIGVSSDSIRSHQKFKEKYELPFTFLADTKGEIRKMFGIKANLFGLLPGRETFVVDARGKIRLKFNSMNATQHVAKALTIIKEISYGA